MDPTTVAALVTLLGGSVSALGAMADSLGMLESFGEKYDEALLLGRQYERNMAAMTAYLGEADAGDLVGRMKQHTGESVDAATLSGMAAEAVTWGVTRTASEIEDLARVAWVRGGISPGGAGETVSEKTARTFQEILDAVARGDIGFLSSRGFVTDETALAGLSGENLVDRLLEEVLKDPLTEATGNLPEFQASYHEQLLADQANAMARLGEQQTYDGGFWYELTGGQVPIGPYDAILSILSRLRSPEESNAVWPDRLSLIGAGAGSLTGLAGTAFNEALEAVRPQWLAVAGDVVDEALQAVRGGITAEVVKELALRLFPDGLPGQRRPTAYGGVQSEIQARGMG